MNQGKIFEIVLVVFPIVLMISLIPILENDYVLAIAYLCIIALSFLIRYYKDETLYFVLGCLGMFAAEYFFISTGVETFERISLLGVMPIWLPLLWGYAFVVIKRSINIIGK